MQTDLPGMPTPRVRPTFAVTGYDRKGRSVGTLYVRAGDKDRAITWALSRCNPLPSWRNAVHATATQPSFRQLGMVQLKETADV